MLVKVEGFENKTLDLGDLIVAKDGNTYLVCEFNGAYVAKNMNGKGGLFGVYPSLIDLNDEWKSRSCYHISTVYKSKDYELKLVKRGN